MSIRLSNPKYVPASLIVAYIADLSLRHAAQWYSMARRLRSRVWQVWGLGERFSYGEWYLTTKRVNLDAFWAIRLDPNLHV